MIYHNKRANLENKGVIKWECFGTIFSKWLLASINSKWWLALTSLRVVFWFTFDIYHMFGFICGGYHPWDKFMICHCDDVAMDFWRNTIEMTVGTLASNGHLKLFSFGVLTCMWHTESPMVCGLFWVFYPFHRKYTYLVR